MVSPSEPLSNSEASIVVEHRYEVTRRIQTLMEVTNIDVVVFENS